MPRNYIDTLVTHSIVGIEIEVTSIQGKWKMSQNKSEEDVNEVINGLNNLYDAHHNQALAECVTACLSAKRQPHS